MADTQDWKAEYRLGPAGAVHLWVSALCICPTTGWGVELRRHDGSAGDGELLLELVLTRPDGPVLQVITAVPVVYEETTDARYERVSILPDGPRAVPFEQVG